MFHFLSVAYNAAIYRPILNALIFLYQTVALRDLGLAIILLTVFIRLILYPLFHKGVRYQMVMQHLQPKIKKIQEEHKGNYEKQTQALMALYREHEVNPWSGFLLLLVQLPVLIALYHVFLSTGKPEILTQLYSWISAPAGLNSTLFGLINLQQKNIVMVGLAAVAQYFQGKLSLPPATGQALSPAEKTTRRMIYITPIITLVIFVNLPAAISLYWLVTTLFSIGQQVIVNRQLRNGKLSNPS